MKDRANDRDITLLPKPISKLLAAYAHGAAQLPHLALGSVKQLNNTESGSETPLRGQVSVDESGRATVSLDGRFMARDESLGTGVELELDDGSKLATKHAYVTNEETSIQVGQAARFTTELELVEWEWSTASAPIAWVGILRGPDFTWSYNLLIDGHGKQSHDSLRLSGNVTWHLVRRETLGKRAYLVVVEMTGGSVKRDDLWRDFAALEFLCGTPLSLNTLIGVDEQNKAVAGYGASFGYRFRPNANREPPLPDEREAAWVATAFPLVARALGQSAPNASMTGTCGYVDSTVGHIDGQYLFAQVTLEAVAERLTTQKKPVVKDVDAWQAWVKAQRASFAEHAVDAAAVNVLAVKLRDASRPTTSRLVEQALKRMGIVVPDEGLAEIDGRNGVAHTLSMTDGQPYDIERDVRRIRIVRTILAALVLRHVGYEGPLAGWDLDERGWRKRAEWFPRGDDASQDGRQLFQASAVESVGEAP